jgi:ketosteroid isomerase-like protein
MAVDELEAPIQTMIDATNREDTTAFLDTFADDAVLIDGGREFYGKAVIARWNATEHIGTHNRLRVTGVTRSGSQTDVTVIVSGQGYNGTGVLAFQTQDGHIRRLVIS